MGAGWVDALLYYDTSRGRKFVVPGKYSPDAKDGAFDTEVAELIQQALDPGETLTFTHALPITRVLSAATRRREAEGVAREIYVA